MGVFVGEEVFSVEGVFSSEGVCVDMEVFSSKGV